MAKNRRTSKKLVDPRTLIVFGERLRPEGTPPTNTPGERAEYITPSSN